MKRPSISTRCMYKRNSSSPEREREKGREDSTIESSSTSLFACVVVRSLNERERDRKRGEERGKVTAKHRGKEREREREGGGKEREVQLRLQSTVRPLISANSIKSRDTPTSALFSLSLSFFVSFTSLLKSEEFRDLI